MDTMAHFLSTGELGDVIAGISMSQVADLLGDPDDVSVQKNPRIWKFGSLELTFYQDDDETQLQSLSLKMRGGPSLPARLSWSGWLPSENTTRQEFESYLAGAGLSSARFVPQFEQLIMPSRAVVVFQEGKLHSVDFTKRTAPKKQLTVTLPEHVWDLVRQEAQKRKVSVTDLCSQWIRDNVGRRGA